MADMYPYHYASGGRILPIARNAGWDPFHLLNDMEPLVELRKKMKDRNLPDSDREKLKEQYSAAFNRKQISNTLFLIK